MLKWEKCRSSLIHKDCHWVHDWENPAPKTAYMTVIFYFHHLKKTKKLCMSLQNKMFLSPKISSGKRKTNYNSCLASTLATLPGVAFAGFCCGTSMQPSSCVRFRYWISCKFISFMWLSSPPGSYLWLANSTGRNHSDIPEKDHPLQVCPGALWKGKPLQNDWSPSVS